MDIKKEVERWRNFSINDEIYDLSHLNAHWATHVDNRDPDRVMTYNFFITYGLHCFTKENPELSSEESNYWMYSSSRESRHFDLERYELSKKLPDIIAQLCEGKLQVFHAGYENFSVIKIINFQGKEANYFVVFSAFREKKKLRLHIASAYLKDDCKRKKINFSAIAKNLLKNKPFPKPPK